MGWHDKFFSRGDRIAASRHEDAFNDVEFVVKGVKLKANSWILALASPVMFANFYGPLAAKDENSVLINDELGTPRGFRAMIDFIYEEEDYSITNLLKGKHNITECEDLEKLMELLIFGDKYQIKSLVIFCRNVLIQKIKFTRQNVAQMHDVIRKYDFLTLEYQMFQTQMQAFRVAIVDIAIFHFFDYPKARDLFDQQHDHYRHYQIKFKVNQDALFHFDAMKQGVNFDHEHIESRFTAIYWEPNNGPKEIVKDEDFNGNVIITKFHAEPNTEITLEFKMCDGARVETYSFYDESSTDGWPDGKFSKEDLEIEIIEINNKPFREAITSKECLPIAKLSFQRLGWGAYMP